MTRIWVAAAAFVYEVTGYAQERAEIGRGYVFHCLGMAWRQGEGTCFEGGGGATGCAGGEEMLMFRIRICKRGLRRAVTV